MSGTTLTTPSRTDFPALDREGHPDELPHVVGVGQVERDSVEDRDVVGQAELELGDERDIDHHGRDRGRDSHRRGTTKAPERGGDGRGVGPGREPTFERGVPSRHLDPLVDDGVRGYALIPLLEVLPGDLVGVGAQRLSAELGEPSARLDVVRAQPPDELP